jgi:hypothetical protein
MTPKARGYLAKAQHFEQCARRMRNQEDRQWQICLARAYRMLAEAEVERSKLSPPDKGAAKA